MNQQNKYKITIKMNMSEELSISECTPKTTLFQNTQLMRNEKLHNRNNQEFDKQKQGKIVMNYVSHIQERKEKDGSAITNEKTKIKLIKRGSTMLNKLPDRANIKNENVIKLTNLDDESSSSNQNNKATQSINYSSNVDLGSYLQDLNASIPVFGYPLLDYSPKQYKEEDCSETRVYKLKDGKTRITRSVQKSNIDYYVPKYKKMWGMLARPITNKYASSIPISEIIVKYNWNEENFNSVMNYFTKGKQVRFREIKEDVKKMYALSKEKEKEEILVVAKAKRK